MAAACVTIDEFITLLPEFSTFGATSRGELVVTGDPAPGDTITVTLDRQDLPTSFSLVAGTDFAVAAGDASATAANIAAAFIAQGELQASSVGATVYVLTSSTGWASEYATAATGAEMAWGSARLTRGDDQITTFLECTCCMINIDQWGEKASCGHAFLAAHFMWAEAGGEAGILTNRKIDVLQEGYAAPTFKPNDATLSLSKYGRRYLEMRSTLLTPPFIGRKHLAFQGFLQ